MNCRYPNCSKNVFCRNFFRTLPVKQNEGRKLAGKGVIKMKSCKSLIALSAIMGEIGWNIAIARADNVILKEVSTPGSYCHLKYPAIEQDKLAAPSPSLAKSGDIIDFYGSCDQIRWAKMKSKRKKSNRSMSSRLITRTRMSVLSSGETGSLFAPRSRSLTLTV